MRTIKVVVIGDNSVGKTWLVTGFISGRVPGGYIPTLFDNFGKKVEFKNKCYTVSIWDTAGNEDLSRMRSLSFQQADVFILCFSMNNVVSFNNLQKWIEGLKDFDSPVVLCGTKYDLRDEEIIDPKLAEDVVIDNGLYEYVETSAVDFYNINKVFDVAVEAVVHPKKNLNGRSCCFGLFSCF